MTSSFYWTSAKISISLDWMLLATHALRIKIIQLLAAKTIFGKTMKCFPAAMLFMIDIIWFGMVLSLASFIHGCNFCERGIFKRQCATENFVVVCGVCGFTTIYVVYKGVKRTILGKSYTKLSKIIPDLYSSNEVSLPIKVRITLFIMLVQKILSCVFIFGVF